MQQQSLETTSTQRDRALRSCKILQPSKTAPSRSFQLQRIRQAWIRQAWIRQAWTSASFCSDGHQRSTKTNWHMQEVHRPWLLFLTWWTTKKCGLEDPFLGRSSLHRSRPSFALQQISEVWRFCPWHVTPDDLLPNQSDSYVVESGSIWWWQRSHLSFWAKQWKACRSNCHWAIAPKHCRCSWSCRARSACRKHTTFPAFPSTKNNSLRNKSIRKSA